MRGASQTYVLFGVGGRAGDGGGGLGRGGEGSSLLSRHDVVLGWFEVAVVLVSLCVCREAAPGQGVVWVWGVFFFFFLP